MLVMKVSTSDKIPANVGVKRGEFDSLLGEVEERATFFTQVRKL